MSEFQIIEKHFKRLTQDNDAALGLKDDAAILKIPAGMDLVVSSDMLNADVHFPLNTTAAHVAKKALRVNLSDLAAMGAKPFSYQLTIGFPQTPDEQWLKNFVDAMLEDQKIYGIFCSGGDTTSIKGGHLSVSITITGLVPEGRAVQRSGAQNGDALVVTGPVGDALIGLKLLQGKLKTRDDAYFTNAYYKPQPRTNIAEIVRQYAHAAIDISDGLVADVGHICQASNCGAWAELDRIRFSNHAQMLLDSREVGVQELITGGDDYELALAIPEDVLKDFVQAMKDAGLQPQVIGRFDTALEGFKITDEGGKPLKLKQSGWAHF